ncbi:unnamed protein product, partial [Polarella glacialis]
MPVPISAERPLGSGPVALGSGARSASPPGDATGLPFAAGEAVEYKSASAGSWIPAKVLRAKAEGCYDLDCKPDVPADKIRRAAAAAGAAAAAAASDTSPAYREGEAVEYFSASQGKWIPAKILAVKAGEIYDLDCKPD